MSSPAHRTMFDRVQEVIRLLDDRDVLVTGAGKYAGNSPKPDFQLRMGWQELDRQVAHSGKDAQAAQYIFKCSPPGPHSQPASPAGAINVIQRAVDGRVVGKIQPLLERIARIRVDRLTQVCQVENGIDAILPPDIFYRAGGNI